MTKRELLEKYYGMACHNLLCYSANYGMTKPRAGYEEEFKKAEVECELLKEMISELPSPSPDKALIADLHSKIDNQIDLDKSARPAEIYASNEFNPA